MAEPVYQLTVGNGRSVEIRSWEDVNALLKEEREAWSWLASTHNLDPSNSQSRVLDGITNEVGTIAQLRQQGSNLANIIGRLSERYADPGGLVHSQSELGLRARLIADAFGPGVGAVNLAVATGQLRPNQIQTFPQFQAAVLAALPSMVDPDVVRDRLEKERANTSQQLRRRIQELEEVERNRTQAWLKLQQDAQHDIDQTRLKTVGRGRRAIVRLARRLIASDASIRATENAYKEQMGLQAPVDYWAQKAETHKNAEDDARGRVFWFFPITGLLLITAFLGASYLLLNPKVVPGIETNAVPNSLFFIISAGLATVAGLTFWVGRLLTRLYLSEHHLRKDAEERAIMTKTYLALTLNGSAEQPDRQIILTALFRGSSDGIVKDDGSADLSLAGLVSRIGVPTK